MKQINKNMIENSLWPEDEALFQVVEEKNVEVPSIDTIKGTEYNIMYNKNGKLACGPYCKLESKYNTELGKKAILKHIVENEGKDAQELPYIATEIEIV